MNLSVREYLPAKERWSLVCAVVFVLGLVIAAIVPPFQAPDEFHHIQRAYLLTHGQIALKSEGGGPSGGTVDAALPRYMDYFTPIMGKAARKVSAEEIAQAGNVQWSDETVFATPTGTAYYFPALYLPQALAMSAGKLGKLSIGQSYKLARFAALFTCVALLSLAFYLYPPPIAVLAVLLLPMNLFLFSAAVLDGVATSTAVLAASAFLRLLGTETRLKTATSIVLVVSVALVASSRANMLPMLLLPFAAAYALRDRRMLIAASVTTLLVVGWTLFTIKTTIYPAGPRGVDTSGRLLSFVTDPVGLCKILWNTVKDPDLREFYLHSFIGVLGWLDTPLTDRIYSILASLLVLILLLSLSLRQFSWPRGLMIVIVAGSVLLTFLALLVQWTIGPATRVDGVQGRYFVIPTMLLIYALAADPRPHRGLRRSAATLLTGLLAVISIHATTSALVARYHTHPQQALAPASQLGVAAPLTPQHDTSLTFTNAIAAEPRLVQLQVLIGTYRASHPGRAKLVLWTRDGHETEQIFELAKLDDNAYAAFQLEPANYVGGRLESIDGEGVSVYQASFGPASVSCLIGVTADGRHVPTAGCP